jgi:integrase
MNWTSPQRVWQSLRQGKALGPKWADVDLDQGLHRIRSTRTRPRYEHGCGGD